jgi:hypothetical protein
MEQVNTQLVDNSFNSASSQNAGDDVNCCINVVFVGCDRYIKRVECTFDQSRVNGEDIIEEMETLLVQLYGIDAVASQILYHKDNDNMEQITSEKEYDISNGSTISVLVDI